MNDRYDNINNQSIFTNVNSQNNKKDFKELQDSLNQEYFNIGLNEMKEFYKDIPHKEILNHYLISYCNEFFNKCDSSLENLIKKDSNQNILDVTTNGQSNLFLILNENYKHLESNIKHVKVSEISKLLRSNEKFDLIYSDHLFFNSKSEYHEFFKSLTYLLKPSGSYLANEHFDKLKEFYNENNISFNSNILSNYKNNLFLSQFGFSKLNKIIYFNPPYAEIDDFVFYKFKK